ncbi:MAG TPA: hypothetical protein VF546_14035 [Pyrinomonadaceae bacterium]|jgi:ABC-type transporter Mla subunit MlaD
MTNEEIEKVLNFIIAREERIVEQQAAAAEQIAALAAVQGAHDARIARFERSYTAIAELLQRHDSQIVALTGAVNQLTETVNRYITARGNNGQGDGGQG